MSHLFLMAAQEPQRQELHFLDPPASKKTKYSDKDNGRNRHDGQAWMGQADSRYNTPICCLPVVLYGPNIGGIQTGKAQQCLPERAFPTHTHTHTHTHPSLERGSGMWKSSPSDSYLPSNLFEDHFFLLTPSLTPSFCLHLFFIYLFRSV